MLKTDKRDALGLANRLYNQSQLGIQVADKTHSPHAMTTANLMALQKAKDYTRTLPDSKLLELQRLAASSIGTKDVIRQRGLVLEQGQLMKELRLLQEHVGQ